MTDKALDLQDGHRRTVQRGTKPAGGWKSDGITTLAAADSLAIPALTVTPPPPPPPDEPPPSGDGPSGIAVPGPKAGWRRAGFTDFDDDIPFGSWTGDRQGVMMGRASGLDTSKRGNCDCKVPEFRAKPAASEGAATSAAGLDE